MALKEARPVKDGRKSAEHESGCWIEKKDVGCINSIPASLANVKKPESERLSGRRLLTKEGSRVTFGLRQVVDWRPGGPMKSTVPSLPPLGKSGT